MTFKLAHLSDLHFFTRLKPQLFLDKRLLGFANLMLRRKNRHDSAVLLKLMKDLGRRNPDHIAVTGDLVNLGLEGEFLEIMQEFERHGLLPEKTSIIPGNHDRYVKSAVGSLEGIFSQWFAPGTGPESYPYVEEFDDIVLVGLSSALPRSIFRSAGFVGAKQLEKLRGILSSDSFQDRPAVVLCHHPPFRYSSALKHAEAGLDDYASLQAVCGLHPDCIVLHGHKHEYVFNEYSARNRGSAFVSIGVPSASMKSPDENRQAAYHLYEFEKGRAVSASRYRVDPYSMEIVCENLPCPWPA